MIDEDLTFKSFGYTSYELKPQSQKKIIVRCDQCGKIRVVIRAAYRSLCKSCCKKGCKHIVTDKTRAKMSASKKGCIVTLEHRKKISAALICRKLSLETRAKMSVAQKGHIVTDKTRSKISATKKGRKHSLETCAKMSIARKGRKASPKAREHISAGLQGISYGEWEGFACDLPYCPKFDEECRESNREKYDRRCFICNKTESENNNRKLSVHHVDRNKQQGCDSDWSLVPLCGAHHGSSHTDEWKSRICYLLNYVW